MSKDRYESPLASRYASEFMLHIFSPDRRIQTWRRLWVALARAEHNLGLPLTAEQDVLRTELAPGLFQNVRQNIAQGATGIRLFEVAEAFCQDPASDTTVKEVRHLAMVLYGSRYDEAWAHADEDMDYVDLKGIVEKLCDLYGEPVEAPWGDARAVPTAERGAALSEDDRARLRAG